MQHPYLGLAWWIWYCLHSVAKNNPDQRYQTRYSPMSPSSTWASNLHLIFSSSSNVHLMCLVQGISLLTLFEVQPVIRLYWFGRSGVKHFSQHKLSSEGQSVFQMVCFTLWSDERLCNWALLPLQRQIWQAGGSKWVTWTHPLLYIHTVADFSRRTWVVSFVFQQGEDLQISFENAEVSLIQRCFTDDVFTVTDVDVMMIFCSAWLSKTKELK